MTKLFEILLEINKLGFELIGGDRPLRIPGLSVPLGILMVGVALALDMCIIFDIYTLIHSISRKLRTKKIKKEPIIGTVTKKTYEEEHLTYSVAFKMFVPHPAKYYVEAEYDGVPGIFDNQELFEKYKEGDDIHLILVQKLNKNGTILEQKLELPE